MWKRSEYEFDNEHAESFNCGSFLVLVRAMTWSNKEQRRMPITTETQWAAYPGSNSSAIRTDYPTIDAAKAAALEAAEKRLESDLNLARAFLADVKKARKKIT